MSSTAADCSALAGSQAAKLGDRLRRALGGDDDALAFGRSPDLRHREQVGAQSR